MKIELLKREPTPSRGYHEKETFYDFEARVNDFIADKKVIDIKLQGNNEDPLIMVMYHEPN